VNLMRLFVAIHLGNEVGARLARELPALQQLAPGARWVGADSVHLTIAFLGHLPEEKVPSIEAAIDATAAESAPLRLRATGLGGFGSVKHPHVLWVGLRGDVKSLENIKKALEARLEPIGYQPEKRDFHPHLTLARAKAPRGDDLLAKCIQKAGDAEFGEARVDRLILFRSELSPRGARHSPIFEAEFRGKA